MDLWPRSSPLANQTRVYPEHSRNVVNSSTAQEKGRQLIAGSSTRAGPKDGRAQAPCTHYHCQAGAPKWQQGTVGNFSS